MEKALKINYFILFVILCAAYVFVFMQRINAPAHNSLIDCFGNSAIAVNINSRSAPKIQHTQNSPAMPPAVIYPPSVICKIEPGYPFPSIMQNQQGTALLKAYIRENGSIGEVRIIQSSGFIDLDRAAADAMAGWKFMPAVKSGENIAAWIQVPFVFKIIN